MFCLCRRRRRRRRAREKERVVLKTRKQAWVCEFLLSERERERGEKRSLFSVCAFIVCCLCPCVHTCLPACHCGMEWDGMECDMKKPDCLHRKNIEESRKQAEEEKARQKCLLQWCRLEPPSYVQQKSVEPNYVQ